MDRGVDNARVPARPTLEDVVRRVTRGVREFGPHRPPSPEETGLVPALVSGLLAGGPSAGAMAAALGMDEVDVDGWTVLASDPASERSWALIALRAGADPDVLVQVPHTGSDLETEHVGFAVARDDPGAALLLAAAHRRAGRARREDRTPEAEDVADVAHRPDSLYALVADIFVAARGAAQVQVHGFADRADAPDVVVSAGVARHGPLLSAVAAELTGVGERVALGTDPACADLAGRRNVQGRSAARHGAEFVHLELSRSVRREPARRDAVAAAITRAVQRWRSADVQRP